MVGIGGARILVVEDEYFIAQDLVAALEAAGAQVVGPASDIPTVLDLIGRERIDAAVLDINLHGIIDFAAAAELERRKIPFVFATGHEPATVPTTYDHVPFWRKPFDVEDLVAGLGDIGGQDGGG